MSIKKKLTLLITAIVTIVLSLNISIYYYSTKNDLQENARQQTLDIAKQINASVKSTEEFRQHMESALAEKLRLAAISAKQELDPSIANVKNEELVELSEKLGIAGITLWQRLPDGDIVVKRSSAPDEIGISSKTWSFWFTAFNELWDHFDVQSVKEGERASHYWSGPINFATTDPSKILKWGDYYDGTTDYIINPFVDASPLIRFEEDSGTNAVIRTILESNPNILEITGFDPEFFGRPIIWKIKGGKKVQNLDVRPVPFGKYDWRNDENDVRNVRLAAETGEPVLAKVSVSYFPDGNKGLKKNVINSYIPIQGIKPYVVGVTFDRNAITLPLRKQLIVHSVISLILIIATYFASFILSGFMVKTLNRIVRKVNEIADGHFGSTVHVESRDELGTLASQVNLMSGNLKQYTDRLKEAAEELRSTKEYLESFVNHTSDAIHVTDLEDRVLSVNKAFEGMFGWRQNDLFGSPLNNLPAEMEAEASDIRRQVLEGWPVADFETVRLGKDGQPIDLSITVSGIRDEYGKIMAIATISRNITARKQTEEVMRRTEKLSIVGQLAAGVAHEIRNPLTTLSGFVQIMKQKGSLSETHMEIMSSELERINFIVSEFLVLSKPQITRFRRASLTEILSDILLFLDTEANMSNVQFATDYPSEPIPDLICEPNQLKQVFLNVLKNAMEAMTGGGVIRISLDDRGDGCVTVVVEDEGEGIPPEELRRLGEPFFSKKETGNGLGLMVSQRIIANHRGTMSFSSELGKGTRVEICLHLHTSR